MEMVSKLKELFKISKPKNRFLGIDIGTYSIKIAEVELVKDKIVLVNFIQGRTYENVIMNGIINDLQYLTTNLKNILDVFKSTTLHVNLSLSYDVVIYDQFQTQYIPTEEEIKSKINEELPYNIEDIFYTYFIFPVKDVYRILYLAAKKEIINQYEKLFENLRLSINNIDADFVNLHNLIEFIEGERNKLIVDWGESKIRLLFSSRDFPVYNRELFKLGLKSLKKEIKKIVKDEEKAEDILVNPNKSKDPSKIKNVFVDYVREVVKEIETSVRYIEERFNLKIETIYLVGGGARIPEIEKILEEYLKIKTKKLNLQDKIGIDLNVDPGYLKVINTQGAQAVAAAIREFI